MQSATSPIDAIDATHAEIASLENRISGLRAKRQALTLDSSKPVESEVKSKRAAEAKIDAELEPLEETLSILKGSIEQRWTDVENSLLPQIKGAMADLITLCEESRKIGVRVLEALSPGGDHLWATVDRLRGLKDAWQLNRDAEENFRRWRDGSLPAQKAFVTGLRDFMEAYPARLSDVKSKLAELASVAAELEAKFPPAALASAA